MRCLEIEEPKKEKMSLDEHLDLPICQHKGCDEKVYMNSEGTIWKYCYDHRMDYFKRDAD